MELYSSAAGFALPPSALDLSYIHQEGTCFDLHTIHHEHCTSSSRAPHADEHRCRWSNRDRPPIVKAILQQMPRPWPVVL